MNYTRLGDYIREVNVRNTDLSITKLLGVNLSKEFIPSVANIIGTDLSNYKVIKKGQFGCKLMSVERDGILPISLMTDDSPAIISSAYYVFEVVDTSVLLPEYLMIYFSYPDFDRRLRLVTGGDVRGGLNFNDFCNMQIFMPSIDEQRKVVAEYQALEGKIRTNEQLINTLQETARAQYHHTFVEGISKDSLPDGWGSGILSDYVNFKVGGDCPEHYSETKDNEFYIPIYSNGVKLEGLYGYTNKADVSENSFTITARGNVGTCFIRRQPYKAIVRLVSVLPKEKSMLYYLFFFISAAELTGDASVQSQITIPVLSVLKVIVPPLDLVRSFYEKCEKIYAYIDNIKEENRVLEQMQVLLLTKLA